LTITGGDSLVLENVTAGSLVGILVVIVILGSCCFGLGALLICTYKITKAASQIKDVQTKVREQQNAKRLGFANAGSESVIDVDQQYVLPGELDIDIFSKKRPETKNNQDNLDNAKAPQ
jgi:hypothetical protein